VKETAMPPKMNRPAYHVWMNPAPDEHGDTHAAPEYVGVVTVTHGDQLRAELEGPKQGLPSMKDAPMHYATIWVWAAMVRAGTYAAKFGQFKAADLAELQPVKDDQEDDDDADPTEALSPASSTGSD
jgi:hypothetical protein